MAKKKAIIGFKGINLAPIVTDGISDYATEEAWPLPYAGSMTRTPKENNQDFHYDDDLYKSYRDISGEEAVITLGEADPTILEKLGLGKYNTEAKTFEGDFNLIGKSFSVRALTELIDGGYYLWKYRVFEVSSVRFGDFQTKGESLQISEVTITGTLKRPKAVGLKPYAIMEVEAGEEAGAAALAFLRDAETFPAQDPSPGT